MEQQLKRLTGYIEYFNFVIDDMKHRIEEAKDEDMKFALKSTIEKLEFEKIDLIKSMTDKMVKNG